MLLSESKIVKGQIIRVFYGFRQQDLERRLCQGRIDRW